MRINRRSLKVVLSCLLTLLVLGMFRVKFVSKPNSVKFVKLTLPHKAHISPSWVQRSFENEYDYTLALQKTMVELVKRNHLENHRVNAVIFVLVRNSELDGILSSMASFEASVNAKYHYPYLLVNDEPFTQEFMDKVQTATKSNVEFDLVSKEHWSVPEDIDPIEHEEALEYAKENNLWDYAGVRSYQLMCRYNSRFFYKHPKILKYRYYMRMEPSVTYDCALPYDPFLFMSLSGVKYGYAIVAQETGPVDEGIWEPTLDFMASERIEMSPFMAELLQDNQGEYNGMHFWSNFEIGDLDFFRNPVYDRFMDAMDESQGFFMRRYGDAPVHSIAVAMLLKPEQIHFFADLGYEHDNVAVRPGFYREFKNKCSTQEPSLGVWFNPSAHVFNVINKHRKSK